MTKGTFRIVTVVIFIVAALCIGALILFPVPWAAKKNRVDHQARIIIPQNQNTGTEDSGDLGEQMAREDSMTAKVPLNEGEVIVSVLNGNFDAYPMEEQFVAYRNLLEAESPIYITFIAYDETTKEYKRFWSAPSAATRPGTISLYTQDLLGDRSICVLLSGMNGLGEHTLTVFHKNTVQINPAPNSGRTNPSPIRGNDTGGNELFSKIAELRIDGNITVRETERTQAYQLGQSKGQSFAIAAYGRDFESSNLLDQVEIIYAYNTGNGLYEQTSRTRIPGTQVEQRRVQEILSSSQAFEDFITGLWYFVTPQGTIDTHQYIYFSPASHEIIFYGDEIQQVFTWQNSTATRYGIYVSSQNISVSTLRRSVDIELESLESLKIKVFEDVRLKIGVNAPWDGSYKKASPPEDSTQKPDVPVTAFIDACYDSSMGKIQFYSNGSYELNSNGAVRQGKYAFFGLQNQEFLELRPNDVRPETASGPQRETYLVQDDNPLKSSGDTGTESKPNTNAASPVRKTLTLLRVRIGVEGIEKLSQVPILLTLASE